MPFAWQAIPGGGYGLHCRLSLPHLHLGYRPWKSRSAPHSSNRQGGADLSPRCVRLTMTCCVSHQSSVSGGLCTNHQVRSVLACWAWLTARCSFRLHRLPCPEVRDLFDRERSLANQQDHSELAVMDVIPALRRAVVRAAPRLAGFIETRVLHKRGKAIMGVSMLALLATMTHVMIIKHQMGHGCNVTGNADSQTLPRGV